MSADAHDPSGPAPHQEALIVLYHPDRGQWETACARMQRAGFVCVLASNPYWARRAQTFEDPDGYRVVVAQQAWTPGRASESP